MWIVNVAVNASRFTREPRFSTRIAHSHSICVDIYQWQEYVYKRNRESAFAMQMLVGAGRMHQMFDENKFKNETKYV